MKIISTKDVPNFIKNGTCVMMGGFLGCGAPHRTIDALIEAGVKDICLIGNDTSYEHFGCGRLIVAKQVRSIIATHIGTNKETGRQMSTGELDVTLVPQGTLAERIRAAGAGLGGILTPTGLGTDVQKGKEVIKVDGKEYLLEKPLFADVALIYATYADPYGNLAYEGTTKNFNPIMPFAADVVIVEVEKFLSTSLDPNRVVVPGVCIDYIIDTNKEG